MLALMLAVPLLLSLFVVFDRTRRVALALAPWAPLPALAVALGGDTGLELSWLLLGSEFGLDPTGRVFLVLTAGLWLIAGIYSAGWLRHDERRTRYFGFHLLTLAGNLGIVVAHDIIGFYLWFLMMTLAAFVLIVHEHTQSAEKAARVYLIMAVAADGFILIGLVMTAYATSSMALPGLTGAAIPPLAGLLLFLGFGVKAGVVPLHLWLPLAHPAAPVPASALLSGVMIAAGVLAWLRFIPWGQPELAGLGALVAVVGLAGAYYGAVVGLTQRDAKTVLAYSSISQIGIITVAVGVAIASSEASEAAWGAVVVYALHHGFAKGALFLGVGIVRKGGNHAIGRAFAFGGLALASLAMVGAPLTSGAIAKSLWKEATVYGPALPEWLLVLTTTGTTLLVLRFLDRVRHESGKYAGGVSTLVWVSWIAVLVSVAAATIAVAAAYDLSLAGVAGLEISKVWELSWPILLGVAVYRGLMEVALPRIPSGDLLAPVEAVLWATWAPLYGAVAGTRRRVAQLAVRVRDRLAAIEPSERLDRLERSLMRWENAGAFWLVAGALLLGLILIGSGRG